MPKTKRKPKTRVRSSEMVSLLDCAIQLNEIVEGVRERRWTFIGMRLKDTKEWCAFYVSLKRAIEQANDKAEAQCPGEKGKNETRPN